MTKPVVKIENWGIVIAGDNPYMAPEVRPRQLHGHVFNHPVLGANNGEPVTTSVIIEYYLSKKRVETRSTVYELGTPSPEFLATVRPGSEFHREMVAAGFMS